MAKNLQDYLEGSSSVIAARKKLQEAKAKLDNEIKALAGVKKGDAFYNEIVKRNDAAKKEVEKAQATADAAINKAKAYFNANKESITAKDVAAAKEKTASNIASVEAQRDAMAKAGLDTTAIDKTIASAKTKAPAGLTATSTSTTETGTTVETINANLDQQIKNSRALLLGMSGAQRKQLATTLTNAGFAVTPTEQFQDALLLQYQAALNLAKSENVNNKGLVDPIDLTGFLSNKTILQNQLKAGQPNGGTGAGTRLTTNISSPTEAAGFIQPLFKSILGRDATPAEVTSITNKLIAAEKDPKNKVKTVTDSKGNVTYSGGIDHSQFITDIVKGLPEFAKKKETATGLTAQSLTATANANGVTLTPEQIDSWSKEIQNGGDINAINNRIRTVASYGQPENVKKLLADGTNLETIYSPYKQLMASTLEINPATIGLNDPTLRMAIGPDREMTTYDYQNALRKDNRWQYTNQAHTEVADATQRILRDFGFQG